MTYSERTKASLCMTAICFLLAGVWLLVPNPLIVVVLCFAPLGVLFVLNQTFWFVSLFVLFSFFRIHESLPALYSLKIPLLLSLGALSALLWHSLISRKLTTYWHPSFTWLTIFWLLVVIGAVLSSNPGLAITYFKNIYWKIIVMTLAIAWLVNSEDSVKKISTLIILAGILTACVALFNSINGIGIVEGSRVTIGRHLGSVLGDPNDLSLVLMFPLAFAISFAATKGIGFSRFIGFTCLILAMAAVIATQSRGGLLGSIAVFGIFGLRLIKSKTLLLFIAVIGLFVLFAMAGISDRQSGGAAEEGIDASAMGRLYAWEAAFKMALDNPLTGVGLNNFYANYFFYSPHWDGLNHAVHSTWFGVLAETGFLGLVVFIGIIVSLIKTSRQTLSLLDQVGQSASPYLTATALAVYAGVIGTIVSGTFLTQGFTWPIYILAALCIALSRITQKYSQNEKPS
ncbi:O-antigen ligase family protein [Vibrio orientalis]|uniref:Membrane protein of ExoQ family involved in exopolysaccharide production n=2 Tax=Vibrio orientalis CIP 102891 = ATCC 33934 TaxID=675816 RepID=A0ABM9YYC4_VIBOR|nr:O-antigen ligase family protein [Vibrio orientalis]EEX92414.1 putative membrane protein of ExoQ family involved in exopolysaccharide production [Vibrio orientalis CIP 102891 = ATCC 33934]